jgi:pimeloyl-ACP methyl ester carboxylesterase
MMFCRKPAQMHRFRLLRLAVLVAVLFHSGESSAQDSTDPDGAGVELMPEGSTRWNVPTPTLGGRQMWGDVLYFRGWRIQQNALSKHFRLLDPDDVRQAWGTREECAAALEQIKRDQDLPPMQGRAVVVIHGIIRSSKSFAQLRVKLEERHVTVVGFDYPSTQVPIEESADYLRQMLQSLEGIEQIDLVVHSMGGLVLRTYLRDHRDPRFHRMVMLGVPNLGARMANIVQQNPLYRLIFGPAGQQLIEDPEGYIAGLPTPDFEFAVIGGARGTENGWNPLIPGDDDGTVSVDNTRLPGAADFMTAPVLHSFLMTNEDVVAATCRFLETGCLHEDGICRPIAVVRTDIE